MDSPSMPPASELVLAARARRVYDELIDRLVDGRFPPEQPIGITRLARELDVSPTPVREALVRLVERRLVVRTRTDYRAAPLLDRDQQEELLEARATIEPRLAALACERSDESFVAELTTMVDDQELRAGRRTDFANERLRSEDFHELVARRADNEFLHQAYAGLGGHVHRFRVLGSRRLSDADDALREHRAIVEAFRDSDPVAAREAMAAHIAAMRGRLDRR